MGLLICFEILSIINQDFLVLITMLLLTTYYNVIVKRLIICEWILSQKLQRSRAAFTIQFFFLTPIMIAIGFSSFRGRHCD